MEKYTIAIVDPISSGYYLAEEANRRGWLCYAIVTLNNKVDLVKKYSDFFECIFFCPSSEDAFNQLNNKGVDVVIAGCENGVEFADSLSEMLGVRGNDPSTSSLRRNKFLMQERLSECGLNSIPQRLVASSSDALQTASDFNRWPVVLKPTQSAGTDGVYVCYSNEEVEGAFQSIYRKKNVYGEINEKVLVQEFVSGEEYIVDAVVRDGVFRVGGVFKYKKQPGPNGAPIYRSIDLIPCHGEAQDKILDYSKRVLEALGVKNGPAHIEIKMDDDKNSSPTLIEVGARMHGGYGPVFSKYGTGVNQLDLTLDAYTDADKFCSRSNGYEIANETKEVFLISSEKGRIKESHVHEFMKTLKSVRFYNVWAEEKGALSVTCDLWSSPGIVVLSHPEKSVIDDELNKIIEAENDKRLFSLF